MSKRKRVDVKTVGPSAVHLTDGTTWPRPIVHNDDRDSLSYRARYSDKLSKSDRLQLAEIADAYVALIAGSVLISEARLAAMRRHFRKLPKQQKPSAK